MVPVVGPCMFLFILISLAAMVFPGPGHAEEVKEVPVAVSVITPEDIENLPFCGRTVLDSVENTDDAGVECQPGTDQCA